MLKHIFFILLASSYIFANAHIFVYHRFGDSKHQSTNTTIKELKKEFEYFKKHNYKVVPLSKIIKRLKNKQNIPSKWVALTIDDSYKSFYTNGLKIFKKYKYPFTLYVYVEATAKKYGDFMSWKQLKDASNYGEIGLHSYSHKHLLGLTSRQIYNDTRKSYNIFKKHMGFAPKSYVYPYGEYDKRVLKQVKRMKFDAILNQSIGSVNKKTSVYDIPRIALVGNVNIKQKLRYKTFEVKWIEPKAYPKNNILTTIKAKVSKKYKKVKLYVTGHGWRDIKVKNGIINEKVNLELKKARIRVMIGYDVFTISSKIIIKGKK